MTSIDADLISKAKLTGNKSGSTMMLTKARFGYPGCKGAPKRNE